MYKIIILQKAGKWLEKKASRFFYLLDRGQEDWEKAWPQLTAPKELLQQLINLLKGKYRFLTSAFILEGIKAATAAAAMIALKKFLEPLETQSQGQDLWMLGAFLILNIVQLLAALGENIIVTALRAGLLCELAGRLFNRLLFFPFKFYQRLESGSIMTHVNRDVALVVDLVTLFMLTGIGTVFTVTAIGIVIFMLNWKVGGFVCLLLLFCIPLVQLARTTVGKYAKRLFTLHSRLLSILQQSLYALKYLKAMGFEQRESLRIHNILEENRRLSLKVAVVHQALGPIMEFFYLLLICGVISVGLFFFKKDIKLSLIAPLVYALLRLSKPVGQLIKSAIGLETNLQAARRVFGTLTAENKLEEKEEGVPLRKPITSINLRKVSYGYDNNRLVLKEVDLELKRGEMAALMGESGEGKSTLCDLIMGLYQDYQGEILINGQELRRLNIKSYRHLLGYVPQEPLLIQGTIRENLLYGWENKIEESELVSALQKAHAWKFVNKLERGLDSDLGERGVNLSGGECQRLCLARALLRHPEVLLLDEATSSLDLQNEAGILEALEKLKQEMIILLISHRFSIIRFVDRVMVLEEGKGRELSAASVKYWVNNSYSGIERV